MIIVHGTGVALGDKGALLRGASGSGKSDLALRFLYLSSEHLGARPALISDDRVLLEKRNGRIFASAPSPLGLNMEVRGVGIVAAAHTAESIELTQLVDLDDPMAIARLPAGDEREEILGVPVRRSRLDPFEPSAAIKLALLIGQSAANAVD
jgi:serine kinase of HPr protein (carbohydrate metabolism regulator)